jgi:arylsulfatase A-like enzyme
LSRRRFASLALLACAVACDRGGAPGSPVPPARWNVLLVSFDTTRADALGSYGATTEATPALDALARDGIVFENAFSPVPLTLPAHTTILTGLDPSRHSVRDNGVYDVPPAARTLPELLKEQGRRTFAVVASMVLLRRHGLDQGFDVYDDRDLAVTMADAHERQADVVAEVARPLLEGSEPFFGFLHFYDPHQPYRAPPDLAARYPDPYVAEIAYADRALGRLIDALRGAGRLERTVVVFTSDHGEARGEHGEATHGLLLHDATQHVPLIVRAPGGRAGRCAAQVRLCDVAPTVLDLLGVAPPPGLDGRSLAPALRATDAVDAALEDEDAYLETLSPQLSYDFAPLYGVRTREWKLVVGAKTRLFHLAEDRGELRDVAADHAELVAALTRKLVHLRDGRGPALDRAVRFVSSEEIQVLGGLGYVSSGSADLTADTHALPDPYDRIAATDDLELAAKLAAANRLDESIALYQKLVDALPGCYAAQNGLGLVCGRRGDHARALDHLQKAAAIHPGSPDLQMSIALAAHFCGRPDLAKLHLQQAIARPKCPSKAYFMLWEQLSGDGDKPGARAVLEQLLRREDVASAERAEAEKLLRSQG